MQSELNSISVFVAVAEVRSFRAAAERLGVTRSAVSQAIGRLEAQLGTALFHRTTRSVNLTEAGARLHAATASPMAEISAALATIADQRGHPRGKIRLAVSSIAESFLAGPMLASFTAAFPDVEVDILVTDEEFDIVSEGYDAGVRLGEIVEQDMIAIRVSADQQQLPVCAPRYLEGIDPPMHPRELVSHRCIGWRPAPGIAPYRWEFSEEGREFDVAVKPEITTNDMGLMIRLAYNGAGITFGLRDSFRPWLTRGDLVPLLEPYCPTFGGFFLYFAGRQNLAPKLRALVEHVKKSLPKT